MLVRQDEKRRDAEKLIPASSHVISMFPFLVAEYTLTHSGNRRMHTAIH